MKWVVLLLGVSGCITSDLVPCGSRSCPVGSVCIEATETCVIQGQLDACASSADDELCVTSIGNGVCLDGVCTISRCGDGTVDLGEVCDDGNLANGDGCRQDCRSDESCGNGLLDQFERCDCGSGAGVLPKGCTMPNSDDVQAECDPACSRACGDAVVTGFEQCDGSTVPATCAQFGFYEGTPACTNSCSLDTSGCEGTCGDGITQIEYGEECDLSLPIGSCLAYGRDYGVLGCGNTCTPAVASTCHFMGWRTLFDSPRLFVDVAGNARGAIATTDEYEGDSVFVRWDGVESHRDNLGWRWTAATPTLLIAGGPTSLGWFDGTWHDVAVVPGVGAQIAATTAGIAFAVRPDCTITRIDLAAGTSTSIASPTATTCNDAVTLGETLYVAHDTGIARWDGTSWLGVLAGEEVLRLGRGRPGHIVAKQPIEDVPGRFLDVDVTVTPAVATVLVASADDAAIKVAVDIEGTLMSMPEAEGIDVQVGNLRARANEPNQVFRLDQSADGTILAVGYGAYRFEPAFLAIEGSPSDSILDLHLLADGAAGYCGDGVLGWLDEVGGHGTRPWPTNFTCWNMIGDPRGEHLAGAEVFTSGGDGLYRWDEETETYELELAGRVDDLAGQPGAALAIMDRTLMVQAGTNWTPVAVPDIDCIANAVESHGTELYALTSCPPDYDGLVQRWTGTALQTLATYPQEMYSMKVTPDGAIFISGSTTLVRLEGSSFVELPISGMVMAGTSKDDIYIGGFDPVRSEGTLYHLQSGVLSQIRAPFRVLAATSQHLYAFDGDMDSLVALPRLPVRLAGKGL